MTWPTHIAGGVVLTSVGLSALGFPVTLPILIIGALGGLAPDLDASDAKIKHFKFSRFKPFWLISEMISTLFGHRGVMHSLLAVVVISIGLWLVSLYIGGALIFYVAFIIGYISHLVADSITKSGIPFLYPWKKRLHLLSKKITLKTGSILEYLILILLIIFFVYWLKANPDFISNIYRLHPADLSISQSHFNTARMVGNAC